MKLGKYMGIHVSSLLFKENVYFINDFIWCDEFFEKYHKFTCK